MRAYLTVVILGCIRYFVVRYEINRTFRRGEWFEKAKHGDEFKMSTTSTASKRAFATENNVPWPNKRKIFTYKIQDTTGKIVHVPNIQPFVVGLCFLKRMLSLENNFALKLN